MGNHAQEFIVVGHTKVFGIAPHSVERYEDVAPYPVATRIVEGDYICEIIMTKKLTVHPQDLLVIAKEIVHIPDSLPMRRRHLSEPGFHLAEVKLGQLHVLCLESNHNISVKKIFAATPFGSRRNNICKNTKKNDIYNYFSRSTATLRFFLRKKHIIHFLVSISSQKRRLSTNHI